MKPLLQNRMASLRSRLRLLYSTVGSCVLWCSESWTPRVEKTRLLTTAYHAMLRRVAGSARAPGEDYLSWIHRVTHKAQGLAQKAGVRNWVDACRRSKWSWAGHASRGPVKTWVSRVNTWRDCDWQALAMDGGTCRLLRPSTRRWMKWERDLNIFCRQDGVGTWKAFAQNRDEWAAKAVDFR